MGNPANLPPVLQSWTYFLSNDPAIRFMQSGMVLLGFLMIFLVFYVTRDILLRTHSLLFMFASIVLVAALPVLGFFIYLLIRPTRTLKEREMEDMIRSLVQEHHPTTKPTPSSKKKKDEEPVEE